MFEPDSSERVRKWFKKLTPAQRLFIAEDVEQFRRGARFVEDRCGLQGIEQGDGGKDLMPLED